MQKILKQIKVNLSLGIVFAIMILGVLIAFPSIDREVAGKQITFDGVDVNDFTDEKFQYDFKFNPTLDFYGGTEVVYQVNDESGVVSTGKARETAKDLAQRMNNIGVTDYDMYLRESDGNHELVVNLPYNAEELGNFNRILASGNSVSLVAEAQQTEEEIAAGLGGSFTPVAVTTADIQSVGLNYGSETSGNGLVIKFTEESWTNVIINTWSDFNNSTTSRIYIQFGEELVAAQTAPVNSQDSSRTMFLTTGLLNDRLSTKLIRDIIVSDNLNTNITAVQVNRLDGNFDKYMQPIQLTFVVASVLLGIQMLVLHRVRGLLAVINVAFVLILSIAAFKMFHLPLAISGLAAFGLALLIWGYEIRNLLPMLTLSKKYIDINEIYRQLVALSAKNLRNYLLLSSGVLVIAELSRIPTIHIFGLYFVITLAVAWLSLVFVLPSTLNLVGRKS